MPARLREAKERRPQFGAEALELFHELESTPARRRHTSEFKAKSKRLGILLGLSDEWWMMLRVENADDPRPRPTLAAHALWPRVQATRQALLAALAGRGVQSADEPARDLEAL
jgi:hypothetical protein